MKKKLITIIFFLVCLNIVDAKFLNYRIHDYAEKIILNNDYKIITNLNALETNEYKQKNFSSYVSETNNFSPKSKQDLLNIYYMITKLVATFIVMVWNFVTRKIFIEK